MDYEKVYGQYHESNPKLFAGFSLPKYTKEIAILVNKTKPTNLLDYGCGKGYQYLAKRAHEAWGGMLPHCYDVGVRQLRERPQVTFDGVICTDVMEHIEEADVPRILDDIFSLVTSRPHPKKSFVFLAISCVPAYRKTLPDGRNVHLTVKPPEWWTAQLTKYERPRLLIDTAFQMED